MAEIVAAIRETTNSQENALTKGSSLGLISETPRYDSLSINLRAHIKASQIKRQLKILTTIEGELIICDFGGSQTADPARRAPASAARCRRARSEPSRNCSRPSRPSQTGSATTRTA